MNREFMKITIILVFFMIVFAMYIFEESNRLKDGNGKPIIIVGGTCEVDDSKQFSDYETDCKALGYSIKRSYVLDIDSIEDNRHFILVSEEFWLFDRILLWGWIS